LNPFLVILNAEIKFRRYIRQGHHTRLSPDVQQLMEKTCELVQLIYWQPTEATDEEGRQRRIAVDCHCETQGVGNFHLEEGKV
jgi:hypothetical protein